jgi:hypothetical protein
VIALPDETAPFEGRHRGFLVVLANATEETVSFPASHSRLSIVREAMYCGTIATRMRFVLQQEKGASIYSNEFPGAINPGQFSTKERRKPVGLMDP